MQNFYISKKSRRPFFEGNRQKVKGALFEVGTIVYVLWRKVFPEKRCSAQERFYFYFNIYDGTMGVCDTLLEDLHSRDIILTVVPSVQKKKIPYELRQLSGHFF